MARIYRVDVKLDPTHPTVRLVRADTRAQAERHVWKQIIESRVATQDDMVELLGLDVTVEDAGAGEKLR